MNHLFFNKHNVIIAVITVFMVASASDSIAQSSSKSKANIGHNSPAKQNAVQHVKKQTGGRVLDIKQRASENGSIWRVKFLKDGKIQYMDVIPQTFAQ